MTIFAYMVLPAMCQPCASADGVLIVSVRFLEYWQHHIGKNWHNRAPASVEYTITPEDGRVRPKHVDE
jgi:hypothetical protein